MSWFALDTWIVIVGILCAAACALPGCFLVLRKMSMMGDAISHAVLPGLALGFLLTGSRASFAMFIGAAVVGVLTAVFTQWVSSFGKVDRGASMGIVFTTLFAVGLLLIVRAADHVDLDPGCVLYGAIELTPLDTLFTITISGLSIAVPRAAVVLSAVFVFNALIVIVLFKELRISSFDPDLATTLGMKSSIMHYVLMAMVAVTTVASFEAVGSIIVIAMLIVPPVSAYMLTDRLSVMLPLSIVFGGLAAFLGHLGAITIPKLFGFDNTNTSGMIAFATGVLFILAWLFGPRYGLMARVGTKRSLHEPQVEG
ncbi:MAG: iron chelate uptake ABC transporter family permease subunit [Chitinivibrionales bacterium]|nr:iron chelate uptake ABC transporter family permease subunit [Chitinivibrionales bacterium]